MIFCTCTLVALYLTPAYTATDPLQNDQLVGKIVAIGEVSPPRLTIRTGDNTSKSVQIVKQTSITKNGQTVNFSALKVGQKITVKFKLVNGNRIAKSILIQNTN